MRILVVGAGGVGGYFGGRLLAAGRDVTFLVRPRRAAELAQTGLVIRSPRGDLDLPRPPTTSVDNLNDSFDLILLSCKAYDLDSAVDALAPAVGKETAILPLLNGMRHVDTLRARFGDEKVLGGLCRISCALDPEGRILHLMDMHALTFGERDGRRTSRVEAIEPILSNANFDLWLSHDVLQEMWEKWVFIAATAGITCLMRAAIGDIVKAGAADLAMTILDECAAIAASQGFPPSRSSLDRNRTMLTTPGSAMTASMLRDMERGGSIEADQIIGDLLTRSSSAPPLLRVAYAHLKAYEARRQKVG